MNKKVLNAYLDKKTGKKFKVWETKNQYEHRNSLRYKQIPYSEVQ